MYTQYNMADLEQLLTEVGDGRDIPEYIRLKRKSDPSATDRYRIRMMQKPLPVQEITSRVVKLLPIAAITYFTAMQGVQAFEHYTAINNALGDIQATLHGVNVLNVPQSGQHILNDLNTVRNNIFTGIVSGTEAAIGASLDAGAVAILQPWKKPSRRGPFWGIA